MIRRSSFVSAKKFIAASLLEAVAWLVLLPMAPFVKRRVDRSDARKVVFIGTQHLGDVLLTTPAIRYIKQLRPDLKIVSVVSHSAQSALESNENVSETVVFDLPWFNGRAGLCRDVVTFVRLVRLLRGLGAAAIVNYNSTGYHREHLAAFLSGTPELIGFAHKGLGFLLTVAVQCDEQMSFPERAISLIEQWQHQPEAHHDLRPFFQVTDEDLSAAKSKILSLGLVPGRPIIVVNPGAQHPLVWPPDAFAEFCREFHAITESSFLFVGSPESSSLTTHIRNQIPFTTYSLVGQTSLRELAAVLTEADCLLTNDTGSRHLANAMACPAVVVAHAANNRGGFHRYAESEFVVQHNVSCSPCGQVICPLGTYECIRAISVTTVVQAVSRMLRIWSDMGIALR